MNSKHSKTAYTKYRLFCEMMRLFFLPGWSRTGSNALTDGAFHRQYL